MKAFISVHIFATMAGSNYDLIWHLNLDNDTGMYLSLDVLNVGPNLRYMELTYDL